MALKTNIWHSENTDSEWRLFVLKTATLNN